MLGPTCIPNLGTLAQRVSELEGKKRKEGGQNFLQGWIARVKVPPCAKFGDPSSKGVGARGQKAEMQKCKRPYVSSH